jgi:hypothetical protein
MPPPVSAATVNRGSINVSDDAAIAVIGGSTPPFISSLRAFSDV